ncbi:MAG: DNRLRE domain-containing protein, partial [Candidatus Bathyarchaeia archaeon]
SSAVAPAAKDVWVSWNVTSAVQGWANGSTPDYGFMIRIQNEQKGASNEASGFYSREYPKEEVRPKLQILCASQPPFTYVFSVRVSGLPSDLASVITADNRSTITVSGGGVGYFLFENGTTHKITADEYITASDSVRYHTSAHSTTGTTDGEFAVTYNPQFRVTMKSEPPGLIEPESSNWIDAGMRLTTPTAQEAFDEGLNKRNVFEGWYANDVKQTGNPFEYVAMAPANLTAQYVMMYNVTLSSPLGQVSGSGWRAAGSSVEITVEPTYLPVEGPLGYLGFGTSFDHWTGTVESTSSAVKVTVDGPVEEKAVWREDRSRLLAGVAVIISLLAVLVVLRRRSRRSGSRESTERPATVDKSKASFERPAIAKGSFHFESNEREREVAIAIDVSEPTMMQLRIRSSLLQVLQVWHTYKMRESGVPT